MLQSNNLKSLISKKTNAVYDYEFIKKLSHAPWGNWMQTENTFRIRENYLVKIHDWILSSQLNRIKNLDHFTCRHIINGTTQTFDESYHRHANRRLRIFRGEYAYHRRCFKNWCFIDDEPLDKNDYIILSYPFCSTGDQHPEQTKLFKICVALNIPVILDCAYFGTCHGLTFDFSSPCIESVSFSLSKGIGLGDIRSGIRYSNLDDSFPISQQNSYNHTVLCAAKIGIYMMEHFSPDHIPTKFLESQLSICRDLNIKATPCIHIGLGSHDEWPEHVIDEKYYRLGLRDAVKARYKSEI